MSKKEITYLDAEKAFIPEAWKIKKIYTNFDGDKPKKGEKKYLCHYETTIVDEEMDPFVVTINGNGMEIKTNRMEWISLSERQLDFLQDTLYDFEVEYAIESEKWKSDYDKIKNDEKLR